MSARHTPSDETQRKTFFDAQTRAATTGTTGGGLPQGRLVRAALPARVSGHKVSVTINQLERHPDVVCQRYGATTNFFAVDRRCRREAG